MQYFICALFDPHSNVTLEGLQVDRDKLAVLVDTAIESDMEIYIRDMHDTDWISVDAPTVGNLNKNELCK